MKTIGFIGAGQMAQALGGGIARTYPDVKLVVSDPSDEAVASFSQAVSSRSTRVDSNLEVFEQSEIVILAIKPQYVADALANLSEGRTTEPLVVSIMAGVSIARIGKLTGTQRIVRVMPNTPCLVSQGASGVAAGETVAASDVETVTEIMASVGQVETVPEPMIDAVTGVSGSGPAYVFAFIEALRDGGIKMGLPASTASALAIQTVVGAAKLIQETGESPEVLRERVTSPGGTTFAALQSLESNELARVVSDAVKAATERSRELGQTD